MCFLNEKKAHRSELFMNENDKATDEHCQVKPCPLSLNGDILAFIFRHTIRTLAIPVLKYR